MTQLMTLALPNFNESFDITTNASGIAIGAVLSQKDKPISFFSKKLCDRMQGKENKVADALSRPEPATVLALSTPTATWLNDLRSYYQSNPEGKSFFEQLEPQSPLNSSHTIHNGLVYNQGIEATIRRLASSFYWPDLTKDVKEFVKKSPHASQLSTKLQHSSAYHPQTDCQTKVVNRCLESYLRAFVHDEPRSWNNYLYLAKFWYNTSYHSSIQITPFKALYGIDAETIHDYTAGENRAASIDTSLMEHQRLMEALKGALEKTRHRMAKQANKKRKEKQFKVGDCVYLRLRNYRQTSVAARENQQLSKRYFGSYRILEKIGQVAYHLELPITSKVHPVFHVSLLNESHSQSTSTKFLSEWLTDCPTPSPIPKRILHPRQLGNAQQLLIQWKQQPTFEATWEDFNAIALHFPAFYNGHEDESVLEREGIDTTHTQEAQQPPRPRRTTRKPTRYQD
nr:reverse transcriptase [Tanacetum cinerariifolium]